MPWRVEVTTYEGSPLIESAYEGVVTPEHLRAAVTRAIEIARGYAHPRVLTDCRLLTGGHTLFDVYEIADMIHASGVGKHLKEAVLLSAFPDTADKVTFFETTCLNRGLHVRVFTDRVDALQWLLG